MSTNVATQNKSNTAGMSKVRFITQVGMLGAIAVILMAFEIPLPFAPAFYKIDFSEVPALIGCFAMGPVAGAMIELIKIVLHLLISGTSTAGVGDIANFAIGCAFILPAAWIYKAKHSRKKCNDRNGSRNCIYGIYRLLFKCICITSGLCKSI